MSASIAAAAALTLTACPGNGSGTSQPPASQPATTGNPFASGDQKVSAKDLFRGEELTDACKTWIGKAEETAQAMGLPGQSHGWKASHSGTLEASHLTCSVTMQEGDAKSFDPSANKVLVTFRAVKTPDSGTGTAPAPSSLPPVGGTAATRGTLTVQVDGSDQVSLDNGRRKQMATSLLERIQD